MYLIERKGISRILNISTSHTEEEAAVYINVCGQDTME